jgi:hypothetical protein
MKLTDRYPRVIFVILIFGEAEIGRIEVQPRNSVKDLSPKYLRMCSSSRVPTLQARCPEFKPQYHQKLKVKKE